jgi:Xaa-Pro aminopeptidase
VIRMPEQHRLAGLRQSMLESGLDSLLVNRREDVRYLSGFTGSSGTLVVTFDRACLITDFRYKQQASRETTGFIILIQKKDYFTALQDAIARMDVDTLWFDESSLTVEGLKIFKKRGFRVRGHPDLVTKLRQQKDNHELANIRTAIRRSEEAFRELKEEIRPGTTERELGLKLEYLIRRKGSRRAAFDIIVASGVNGAMPHAAVTNRRLKKGDLVTFDFGAEANGYYSDITRTVCVGRPSAKQREIHGIVLRAQAAAIQSVRTGISCKSVDDAARKVIKGAGYGRLFGHGTGHGIGLMVHEGPSVSPLSREMVKTNMVFTVEPGVYVPGWGGVRIEDMVQVTRTGVKVLTSLPRELESIGRS